MIYYTFEEMRDLLANYSELTDRQKFWIMQSIRHIIANFDSNEETNVH